MASINVEKEGLGSIGGIIKIHNYRTADDGHSHSNTDIDLSKTNLNYSINGYDGQTVIDLVKEKKKEYDTLIPPKRVRSDRKVYFNLSVPCPSTIPMERRDEFFQKSYDELQKVFDGCLIDGMVHKDEVHTYIDPTTKTERISLEHMHIVGVPFTETNGLNMKSYMTKKRLTEMNKCMVRLCKEEFDIEWNTGEGKDMRTMEQLKAASLKEEIKELRAENERLSIENLTIEEDNNKIKSAKASLLGSSVRATEYQKVLEELRKLKEKYKEIVKKFNSLVKKYKALYKTNEENENKIAKYAQDTLDHTIEIKTYESRLSVLQKENKLLKSHIDPKTLNDILKTSHKSHDK